MRFSLALTTLAFAIGLGCAAPRQLELPGSRQSRQRLCEQLSAPADRTPPATPRAASATRADHRALEGVGKEAMASVVDIHTSSERDRGIAKEHLDPQEASKQSTGSGVVIAADGLILTNEHVVRNAAEITVVLLDGSRHRVERVAIHPKLDLAVLRINRRHLRPLTHAGAPVQPGVPVVAVAGASFREEGAVRDGVITQVRVSLQHALDPRQTRLYAGLVESTTKIEPGFSGGALLDADGNLIGINVAISGDTESDQCRGYAIPLKDRARQALAKLIARVREP